MLLRKFQEHRGFFIPLPLLLLLSPLNPLPLFSQTPCSPPPRQKRPNYPPICNPYKYPYPSCPSQISSRPRRSIPLGRLPIRLRILLLPSCKLPHSRMQLAAARRGLHRLQYGSSPRLQQKCLQWHARVPNVRHVRRARPRCLRLSINRRLQSRPCWQYFKLHFLLCTTSATQRPRQWHGRLGTEPNRIAKSYTLGERSVDHFIRVTSIKVNGRVVPVNKELLKIHRLGIGGTKITTTAPYTLLETSIYRAVSVAFDAAMNKSDIERVASVAPFKLCYSAEGIRSANTGPAVPTIDFVLQSDNIRWRIWGANSMVEAKAGVLCLGFVNGG